MLRSHPEVHIFHLFPWFKRAIKFGVDSKGNHKFYWNGKIKCMREGQINMDYLIFREWIGNVLVGSHNEGFLGKMLSSCYSPLQGRIEQEDMGFITTGEI